MALVGVRQFREDEALKNIMEAFWREGFQATSIDDLVAATGLKRGSLYAAFGDKERMFLRAYDWYVDAMEVPLLAALDRDKIRDALGDLFNEVIGALEDPGNPPGCLIAQTMCEAAGRGDAIEVAARQSFTRAERAIRTRLVRARDAGEISDTTDLRALSRFIAATMRTLAITHRLTGDRQTVADIATTALQGVLVLAEPR